MSKMSKPDLKLLKLKLNKKDREMLQKLKGCKRSRKMSKPVKYLPYRCILSLSIVRFVSINLTQKK